MNDILTKQQAIKHSRYKIYQCYFGLFNEEKVIAFCESLEDAKMITDALNKKYEDRPMKFDYIRCREYDKILDEEFDLQELGKSRD